MIISPSPGTNTTNTDILVGWTDYPGNFSTYKILISGDIGFSDVSELESMNAYATFRNLDYGIYHLKAQVYDGGTLLEESPISIVRVNERPQFAISIDHSEYSSGNVVVFRIDAPLGSAVDIKVDGTDDDFSYHPASLATDEFRTVLSPGDYTIAANLTYFDYFTTFQDTFTLQESEETVATTQDDTGNLTKYLLNITTVDSAGERLPLVLFTTMTIDTDSEYFYNETEVTGTDGVRRLILAPEIYLLEFSKKGYKSTSKVVDLDYENISITVTLEKDDTKEILKLDEYELDILSPLPDERVENKHVNIKVYVNGSFDSCQVLYSSGEGWKVAGNAEDGEQVLTITDAPPGNYDARIDCIYDGETYSSDERAFMVYTKIDDDSLIQGMLSEIEQAKKNVNILNDESIITRFNFLGILKAAEQELTGLNAKYNELLNDGADEEEVQAMKESIRDRIDVLRNELPKSVEIGNSEDHAVYLPVTGFEDLYADYKTASGEIAEKRDTKFQKSAQEDFIVKKTLNHVTVIRMSGSEETYSAISETISSFGEIIPEKIVIYIDDGLTFTGVEFISQAAKVDDNFYELSGDQIEYFFKAEIDLQMAKGIKTMIIAPILGGSDTPTGFAISDLTAAADVSHLVILVIIIVALIGGYVLTSGGRKRKKHVSALAVDINKALDHLEKGEPTKAFSVYPRILGRHKQLDPEKKSELSQIMQYLHGQLEEHNLSLMLTQLDRSASDLASNFDDDSFTGFIDMFNQATQIYNGLDDTIKPKYFGQIDNFHNIIQEIQQIQ